MKKKLVILFFVLIGISSIKAQQQQQERFLIKNIDLNTKFASFGTTFYGSDKVIYSSANSQGGFLNLYVGNIDDNGEIIKTKKLIGPNTKYHESNVVFSKNEKTVYFSRSIKGKINTLSKSKDQDSRIVIMKADVSSSGHWTNTESVSFNSTSYDVGHPAISKDGKKMYFTSNMPGTLGSTDIFVVDINADGSFGTPKNMGENVNSIHKEMFPHIDEQGILFFSSNRPDEGYGGLDMYAVKIYEDGEVSERLHLEPPINSDADDFNYIFDQNKKQGYFSSNRNTGLGEDDIYFFTETRPLLFDCYQTVSGVVIDKTTQNPIPFATVTLKDANGKTIEQVKTEKDGKFSFSNTVCDTAYEILGEKKYYASNLVEFISADKHDGTMLMSIPLADDFIVHRRGKRMLNIDEIHFDYDSAEITPTGANQLNRVINTMNRYPKMVIELGAHTDARGKDLYNLVLSNKRARSVIQFVKDHGIAEDRISGKGYGEKKLINHCKNGVKCTEKEHELNRRSEFVIIKM